MHASEKDFRWRCYLARTFLQPTVFLTSVFMAVTDKLQQFHERSIVNEWTCLIDEGMQW